MASEACRDVREQALGGLWAGGAGGMVGRGAAVDVCAGFGEVASVRALDGICGYACDRCLLLYGFDW